ncbi:MAG: diguanylate cyclase [Deltaproteobacteria bacterium]|nr:diguanylate cyclase [Deltaproteobacteria bacterium]
MSGKPTYEELELRVRQLEESASILSRVESELEAVNQELEASCSQFEEIVARSNQMAVEAEIANLELNQIFNAAADGIWVINSDFTVLRINQTFLRFLGADNHGAVNRKCYDLFSIPLCHGPKCPLTRIMTGEERIEYDIQQVCGENEDEPPFLLSVTPLIGLSGEKIGIVGNFTDIADRKKVEAMLQEANRKLQYLAIIDGLTQLANRRRFDECLEQEWKRLKREEAPLSLIMCDVDFFKLYNDTYGHQLGDDCLRSVAEAIRQSVKRSTDLAARYGGEEFGVILPNTNKEGALHTAEVIRNEIKQIKIVHSQSKVSRYVTLSLGISTMIPSQGLSPEALVKEADKALYTAKEQGRDRAVVYIPD